MFTANTARVLKLKGKGTLAPGADADVLVFDRSSLELREVIAGGRRLMRAGELVASEDFLDESNRRIEMIGAKAEDSGGGSS